MCTKTTQPRILWKQNRCVLQRQSNQWSRKTETSVQRQRNQWSLGKKKYQHLRMISIFGTKIWSIRKKHFFHLFILQKKLHRVGQSFEKKYILDLVHNIFCRFSVLVLSNLSFISVFDKHIGSKKTNERSYHKFFSAMMTDHLPWEHIATAVF